MKIRKILFSLLLLMIIIGSNPYLAKANQTPSLNIVTDEHKVLFNLNNLKPGDWAVRTLTIQNRGEEDFTYISDARLNDGSEKLYNEFLLKVSASEAVLYDGKMKDFNGFTPRLLKSLHEEELEFEVEFPSHLGNDFQGLASEVLFRFYIEELIPVPENPGGPSNPTPDPEDPENPGEPGNPTPDPEDPENPGDSNEPTPDPEDPNDSEIPTGPGDSDPDDPTSPDGSGENDVEPQRPISPDNLGSEPGEGQVLPATATNMFNYILAGAIILALGIILLQIIKKRRVAMKY